MTRKLRAMGGTAHRWRDRTWLGIATFTLALLLVGPAKAQNFESALESAADAIAGAVERAGKQRVAVIDFDQIEGQVTALGRFLAEEVSANLAERPRPFAVIDRANLQSILSEHALSMSGLVNPENARRLGQIAGVDALVLGTYTDFGETYRLSLKAITTDTAQMVASARTNVPKTNALVQLAGRVVDQRGPTPRASPSEAEPSPEVGPTPPPQAAAPDVLYETSTEKDGFENWPTTRDWKRLNGMLLNDGTMKKSVPIYAPYKPKSADYVVEAEIRVNRSVDHSSFGFFVRVNGNDGYAVGVLKYYGWRTAICYSNIIDDYGNCIERSEEFDYKSTRDWHTYRVEVKGNTITMFMDGSPMTSTIDNRFLSAGQVGLWSRATQLDVRNFKVTRIGRQAAALLPGEPERAADPAITASGSAIEAPSEARPATRTSPARKGAGAKRHFAKFQDLSASVPAGFACETEMTVTVQAPDDSAFEANRMKLQKLVGGLRAALGFECPGTPITDLVIVGEVGGREVYRGTASESGDWLLADLQPSPAAFPEPDAAPPQPMQTGRSRPRRSRRQNKNHATPHGQLSRVAFRSQEASRSVGSKFESLSR
jgi:hypothetical protein